MEKHLLTLLILSLSLTVFAQEKTKVVKKAAVSSEQIVIKQGVSNQVMVQAPLKEYDKNLSDKDLDQIYAEISELLLNNHFDEEGIKELIPGLKSKIAEYKGLQPLAEEFIKDLTSWLRTKTGDKHYILQEVGRKSAGAVKLQGWYGEAYNYGLSELKWFPERIGYMNFRGFNPAQIPDARQAVDQSITFLRNAESIIIDLRENRGGDGAMAAYLMSYFLPADSVPLCHWDSRYNGEIMSSIEQSYISLPVPRLKNKDIYILTSRKTGSAAELLAIYFKSKDLATLVGENTAGGTHTMATFPVANRFTFGLPNGRKLDLKTHEDLQVSGGIVPDIKCDSDEALEKTLEIIMKK